MPKNIVLTIAMLCVVETIDVDYCIIQKTIKQAIIDINQKQDKTLQELRDGIKMLCDLLREPKVTFNLSDVSANQLTVMLHQITNNRVIVPPLSPPHVAATAPTPTREQGFSMQPLIPQTANSYPLKPFNTELTFIDDMQRKWHKGLGMGNLKWDSIISLDLKYGTSWQFNKAIKIWYL